MFDAPAQRPTRKNALLLFLLAGAGLFAATLLMMALDGALQGVDANLVNLINHLFYYLCFLALPIALSLRRRPGMLAALRPNPISPLAALAVVALALMGFLLANDITILWCIPLQKLGLNVEVAGLQVPGDTAGLMICVLYTAMLPGVCEEFLFRGAMLSAFEAEGTRRAMVATSLLFMLLHGSPAGAPSEFLVGMIIAALVIYTDSIYAGLIYHTVHNTAAVLLQFIQNRNLAEGAAAQTDYLTAIGGVPGVAALLIDILFFGSLMWMALRLLRMRALVQGLKPQPSARKRLVKGERGLLVAGIAIVALLYVANLYLMLM